MKTKDLAKGSENQARSTAGDLAPLVLGGALAALAIRHWLTAKRHFSFAGKTALVMGGSRGLGLTITEELLLRGAQVMICARSEEELVSAQTWLYERTGQHASRAVCDVSNRKSVRHAVEAVVADFGKLDALINVAGIIQVAPLASMTNRDFEQAMAVMYWGPLYAVWEAMTELKKTKGRIVNITSIGGRMSVPHLTPYCSAKYAGTGLSLALRAELKKDGVLVTTVTPGLMRTGSFDEALFKSDASADYNWFSVASSMPLITVSARRAARMILAAAEDGVAFKNVGFPAAVAGAFAGAFPGLTAEIMSVVNALLPKAGGEEPVSASLRGEEVHANIDHKAFDAAIGLGTRAKAAYQRHG